MVEIPLLTICVPTYNRREHLEKLIFLLDDLVAVGNPGDVEIVIVNNCSTDGTFDMLVAVAPTNFRVINRTAFLLTAEENIMRSLAYCTGRFVWFLGDDDVPVTRNFEDYLARLRDDQADYFFFNPALVDPKGTIVTMQLIPMNAADLMGNTVDLIQMIGCTFAFAGISNHIIRRSLLSLERGLHYLETSQIYSNVAWMVEAGARARTVLVNSPLVYYRENDYDPQHWPRAARTLGVGDYFFWSLGLVHLFTAMVEAGVIDYPALGTIFEVGRDGNRSLLLNQMMFSTFRQICHGLTASDPRQQFTANEMTQIVRFCTRVDGLTFDIMACLTQMNNAALAYPNMQIEDTQIRLWRDHFHNLFNARRYAGQWIGRVIQHFMGYQILWTPTAYVAILAGVPGLSERVMRFIDPLPVPPLVFIAREHEALHALLRDYVHAHPDFMTEANRLEAEKAVSVLDPSQRPKEIVPPQPRKSSPFVVTPFVLLRHSFSVGGASGTIKRIWRGLRRYGFRGFFSLAFGRRGGRA
ncbi:MAG: glycosyltransferase family 2 protein [Acidocella sp.]|nr:glycosyltransferase family 2 protein [Acidocella sp.]